MARWGVSTGWVGRHRLAITSWLALSLVTACLVALAVRSQGYPVHRADLNDGGVWVTGNGLFGRENKPIKQLDLSIRGVPDDPLDVLQNQQAVVAVDRSAHTVTPVDTSQGTANSQSSVTVKSPDVHLGGQVVALTDPGTGKVWATQVSTAGGGSALDALDATSKPLTRVNKGSTLTVSTSGTVYVAASGKLTTIAPFGSGFAAPSSSVLSPAPEGSVKQLTTVGEHVVWLDDTGTVGFAGHRVSVGQGAMLQQPGPDAQVVLVDTPTELLSISLGNGAKRQISRVSGVATASAPVNLGGCAWGLWASDSEAQVAQQCGSGSAVAVRPFRVSSGAELVFRVNRTSLLVNDMKTGKVWDVDGRTAQEISDWQALEHREQQQNENDPKVVSDQRPQPKAIEDKLGARVAPGSAGPTTVLHVLDNDLAPSGDTLAITDLGNVPPQLSVHVAPDQQALLASVNGGVTPGTTFRFSYTIDDGEARNNTATGYVDLTARGADDPPAAPHERENYAKSPPPSYPVAAGESVDIPVLADWRDRTNGDPVSLVPNSVTAKVGKASITPDGVIRYVAPEGAHLPPTVAVPYEVTTGGATAKGSLTVRLFGGTETAAPTAEPDVSAGTVGNPIVIHPLDNDVPGADPVDSTANLVLSGNVAPESGVTVKTDPDAGTVTVVAHRPGSYTLQYHVAYGSAAGTAGAKLRVIVQPSSKTSDSPIAMPDTAVVHGSAPTLVDVLANDYDPQGRLLAVQQATGPEDAAPLSVAVVDGRWIRVSNPSGQPTNTPQVVHYQVSNGVAAPVDGTLTVSLRDPIESVDDAPDAEPDVVTVRAGTSADIPVLDNDSTPSGDPVALASDPDSNATPGTLPVDAGSGTAYLDGKYVRFVAPPAADVHHATDTHFSYLVENASDPDAGQSTGLVTVHITPPSDPRTNPDQDPTPSDLEGRVVQGDTVTLTLPLMGQDPDGDPVAVSSIGDPNAADSTPKLGQVIGYGADSISYQAFPGQTGQDEFTYTVIDPDGHTGEATARIAVVAPGAPQSPVALPDTITVDPARTLTVDVLANDLIPQGTTPTFSLAGGAPHGVTGADGIVTIKPHAASDDLSLPYTISNGLASSSANLNVHFKSGFDNPPIAGAVTATPTSGAARVTTKVLDKVSDIDDPHSALTLVSVDGLKNSAIHGGSATLPVGPNPRVWTYHVRDPHGAVAVGSIYEAGLPTSTPYLKKGSVLHLAKGKSAKVNVARYVITPAQHTKPYLTTDNEIFTAPSSMFAGSVSTPTNQTIEVTTAPKDGPATLTFQVADQKHFSSTAAHTAMISLPVVIGDPPPTLTCPSTPIPVPNGGAPVTLDVGAICHVWRPPGDTKSLSYSANNASGVHGISVGSSGERVTVRADNAKVGSSGYLEVKVDGYRSSARLPYVVTKLPAPTLRPLPDLHATSGQTVTIDLARFLSSPLENPEPTVLGATPVNGGPAAKVDGSSVSISVAAQVHGTFRYRVAVSDSGRGASADRQVTGTFEVQMVAAPQFPGGARISVLDDVIRSEQVRLHWPAAAPNGSPVTKYVVSWGSGSHTCPTTTCTITGLQNGKAYNFTAQAFNAVGGSAKIGGASAMPDQVPTAVSSISVLSENNQQVVYSWPKPDDASFGDVTGYLVSWTGHPGYKTLRTTAARPQLPVPVANGVPITFTVRPFNELYERSGKFGAPTTNTQGVASGAPEAPAITSITGTNVAGGGTKAFVVSWSSVAANGRGSAHYSLFDNGTQVSCGGVWSTSTSCTAQVPNNGVTHHFQVKAANDAGVTPSPVEGSAESHQSPMSAAQDAVAAGTPSDFSGVSLTATGKDGEATLKFTVGPSNGKSGTVTCSGSFTCGSIDVGTSGQSVTKSIEGLTDGAASSVTLTYCNGAVANADLQTRPCVTSSSVSTTTYGPIGTPTISVSASDNTITVNASVNTNGAAATMTIKNNKTGATHGCGTSSSGTFTCPTWTQSDMLYSTTYTYTVTVTDASGHERQSTSKTGQVTTRAANPRLSISWGSAGSPDYCKGTCYQIKITGSELQPGQITIYYDTDCATSPQTQIDACEAQGGTTHYASGSYTVDSNGNLSVAGRYFGYIGAHVWVDATTYGQHVESNHITCP